MNVKKLLAVLAMACLLAAGLAFAAFSFGPKDLLGRSDGAAEASHEAPDGGKPSRGIMYSTRERVLNLADPGGMRYLKTEIVLELELPKREAEALKGEAYKKRQEELQKELAPIVPAIDDSLTTVLSGKRTADLLSPEGKEALKAEIRERLQPFLHEYPIKNVYLPQFIVQ